MITRKSLNKEINDLRDCYKDLRERIWSLENPPPFHFGDTVFIVNLQTGEKSKPAIYKGVERVVYMGVYRRYCYVEIDNSIEIVSQDILTADDSRQAPYNGSLK